MANRAILFSLFLFCRLLPALDPIPAKPYIDTLLAAQGGQYEYTDFSVATDPRFTLNFTEDAPRGYRTAELRTLIKSGNAPVELRAFAAAVLGEMYRLQFRSEINLPAGLRTELVAFHNDVMIPHLRFQSVFHATELAKIAFRGARLISDSRKLLIPHSSVSLDANFSYGQVARLNQLLLQPNAHLLTTEIDTLFRFLEQTNYQTPLLVKDAADRLKVIYRLIHLLEETASPRIHIYVFRIIENLIAHRGAKEKPIRLTDLRSIQERLRIHAEVKPSDAFSSEVAATRAHVNGLVQRLRDVHLPIWANEAALPAGPKMITLVGPNGVPGRFDGASTALEDILTAVANVEADVQTADRARAEAAAAMMGKVEGAIVGHENYLKPIAETDLPPIDQILLGLVDETTRKAAAANLARWRPPHAAKFSQVVLESTDKMEYLIEGLRAADAETKEILLKGFGEMLPLSGDPAARAAFLSNDTELLKVIADCTNDSNPAVAGRARDVLRRATPERSSVLSDWFTEALNTKYASELEKVLTLLNGLIPETNGTPKYRPPKWLLNAPNVYLAAFELFTHPDKTVKGHLSDLLFVRTAAKASVVATNLIEARGAAAVVGILNKGLVKQNDMKAWGLALAGLHLYVPPSVEEETVLFGAFNNRRTYNNVPFTQAVLFVLGSKPRSRMDVMEAMRVLLLDLDSGLDPYRELAARVLLQSMDFLCAGGYEVKENFALLFHILQAGKHKTSAAVLVASKEAAFWLGSSPNRSADSPIERYEKYLPTSPADPLQIHFATCKLSTEKLAANSP